MKLNETEESASLTISEAFSFWNAILKFVNNS